MSDSDFSYNYGSYGYARQPKSKNLRDWESSSSASSSSEAQVSSDTDDDSFDEDIGSSRRRSSSRKGGSSGSKKTSGKNSGIYGDNERKQTETVKRSRSRRNWEDTDEESSSGGWEDSSEYEEETGIAFRKESRNVTSVSYADSEEEESDSSEEDKQEKKPEAPKGPTIDRIIGYEYKPTDPNDPKPKYYIKMTGESYKKCRWMTEEEINNFSNGKTRLVAYRKKIHQTSVVLSDSVKNMMQLEDETFSDQNLEPDRVIARNEEGQYLVLWSGTEYKECTWEDATEIDDDELIEAFERRNDLEAVKSRPEPNPGVFRPYGTNPGDEPLPEFPDGLALRDYQVAGVNWLRRHWYHHTSAILADEMGLGKTVMGVNIIYDLYRKVKIRGPFLVIAPLSTLDQWAREFKRWTPMNVIKYTGQKEDKQVIAKYELVFDEDPNIPKFEVILTNFDVLIKEDDIFKKFIWEYVIVDEAHALKNIESKRYQFVQEMQIKSLLLMTGTPIQNRLEELWALLHLIDQEKFSNLEYFLREFNTDGEDGAENIERLQERLRPYMLRRKKADVERSIGRKEETIVNVELTRPQKLLYKELIEQKAPDLTTSGRSLPLMSNLAMELRKVCCHPYLIKGNEIVMEATLERYGTPLEKLIHASGKMVFVDKLLTKLYPTGSKVLIFSQFKLVLNIIQEFLEAKNYKFERIDGERTGKERQRCMDRFEKDDSIFVFLLSTRAGGLGLNLTAANTVIIYDSDWNPQNDIQAQARCHRIGQKAEKVTVYRLITRNTYESEMFEAASRKLGLDQALLDTKSETASGKENKAQMERLLKKGAYYAMNENYEECDQFEKASIEEILNSHTREFTAAGGDANSSFSTTNFGFDEKAADIDYDDPNFWKKYLGDTATYRSTAFEPAEPRKRKSRKFYDDSDDDGIQTLWKDDKVVRAIGALRRYGFGNWKRIKDYVKLGSGGDELENGCVVLVDKITAGKPDDAARIIGKPLQLTPAQRALQKEAAFKSNAVMDKLKSRDKIIKDMIDMQNIKSAVQGAIPEIKPSADWNSANDLPLLRGIYTHGHGKVKDALNDDKLFPGIEYNDELEKAAKKRLKKLMDALNTSADRHAMRAKERRERKEKERRKDRNKYRSESGVPKQEKEREREDRPEEMLTKLLVKTGLPSEGMAEILSAKTGIGKDKIIEDSKEILKAAKRVTSGKSLKSSQKPLATVLTAQMSSLIERRRHWFRTFRHFMKHEYGNVKDKLGIVKPDNEPSEWSFKKFDPILLKRVQHHGLLDLTDAIADNEVVRGSPERTRRAVISFVGEDEHVIAHIDHVIHILTLDTKKHERVEVLRSEVEQERYPMIIDRTLVESIGDGSFFAVGGYLCRVGFRATVRHGGESFYCSINGSKKFVIKTSSGELEGATPEEAWRQAEVEGGGAALFGVGIPRVRYWMQKALGTRPITGYVPIDFLLK